MIGIRSAMNFVSFAFGVYWSPVSES